VNSLIASDDTWVLWAVLLSLAALGLWAERTRWGQRVSGYAICILAAITLSNLRVIPIDAPVYDVVWDYFVPLAIPLLLFKADLRRVIRESGPTLLAFTVGAVGTVLGTILAFFTVALGPDGWKMAASFCATYIGGSMNYVATAKVTGLDSSDLLTAGVAADNLLTTGFLLLLFALPGIGWLRRRYADRPSVETGAADGAVTAGEQRAGVVDLTIGLALSAVICAVGFGAASWLESNHGIKGVGILVITALVVAAATIFPKRLGNLAGADGLGTALMYVFFVALGASASIERVLGEGLRLFAFAGIVLTVHLTLLLIAGKLLRLDLREIVIASNANVGGPATAVALAVARRWNGLIVPSILTGTLGYAVATFIGAALGSWLR
jgi:uncharacterized membrane protein